MVPGYNTNTASADPAWSGGGYLGVRDAGSYMDARMADPSRSAAAYATGQSSRPSAYPPTTQAQARPTTSSRSSSSRSSSVPASSP